MRVLKRVVKSVGVGLGVTAVFLLAAILYARLDKTEVFLEVRGAYEGTSVVESWETEQSEIRLLELRNHRSETVAEAYIRRPFELDPDYRIVLTYAGAKTGKKILELIPERSDLVLVGVQYPYRSPHGVWQRLHWPYDVRQAVFRTVAGGMLAVSCLEEEEGLDIDRLLVAGASLGATFATMHGALDERVPTVLLIHGGADLPALVRINYQQGWLTEFAVFLTATVLHSFEPLDYVDRISPRRLVMISARRDTMVPPEYAEMLYDRALQPKEIIWTESAHVRSAKTELVAEIVRQLEWYLENQ